ncbi:MAG: class I SAM-dependent methyltransferase [Thiotrichales bacterium]|nr:class I SAM-dependent methyltransferase [Thiotrichales bacterium]
MKDMASSKNTLLAALTYAGAHINKDLQGKAWVGHTPFAYWLVASLKPKTLVELGTHGGGSYFSFCQSVVDNKLDTKTYAIDTWTGEKQAGFYSESLFKKVMDFNIEHFDNFSTLMKMTFDEALNEFDDNSVDLLHIDGFHSYEAVSNDFRTWYPKLSKEAIVLFHDTHEIKPGFGVHQFWDELKKEHLEQCFEFKHSHGLGMCFPKSSKAAINFKKEFSLDLEKIFNLFSIIGDDIYYNINGRYSLQKNFQLSIDDLVKILKKLKTDNPELSNQLKSLL